MVKKIFNHNMYFNFVDQIIISAIQVIDLSDKVLILCQPIITKNFFAKHSVDYIFFDFAEGPYQLH